MLMFNTGTISGRLRPNAPHLRSVRKDSIKRQRHLRDMYVNFCICNHENFPVMLGRSHRFRGITSTFFAQGHDTATRVGLELPTTGSGLMKSKM